MMTDQPKRGVLARHRRGVALATACAGMVAAVAVVVTVAGANPSPSAVRLHMASDGKYFAYGSTTQSLTTSSGCKIGSAEPLIDLSSGSGTYPGLGSDALGVKSGSSNGTPCSQVDKYEYLKLKKGSTLGARKFTGVRLDVEMTGNAVVKLVLSIGSKSATYLLKTGTSIIPSEADDPDYDTTAPYLVSSSPGDVWDACAAPNASGPNSGGNDNCLWTVQPGFQFDTITLTTLKGTVALEGAGDFGGAAAHETLLYLDNSPPTANNDTFSTPEDTALAGNVLANDTDPDGSPLTASVLTGPTKGSLALSANGAFTYTPNANSNGTDSFTYKASDGVSSSNATATITVAPVNDAPVASNEGATTQEDTEVTVEVGTDIDSTELVTDCEYPDGSTFSDNGDGTVQFTPPPDFHGELTLICTVTDDQGASSPASALVVVGVVSVNDPPVAVDDEATANEDGAVDIDVLANDLDVDGDTLSVAPGSIANVLPLGATAVVDEESGNITYTPPTDFSGTGSFTYRATDGTATSAEPATVTIDVFPVICTNETVTDEDGDVTGAFTRLEDEELCKRYDLDATVTDGGGTVIFNPEGGSIVTYRGVLTFPGVAPPDPELGGEFPLLLLYDPTGGETYQPVPWCVAPQFDEDDRVTSATLPGDASWCVASAAITPNDLGDLETTWQVYGEDDPRFTIR